MKPTNIFLFPTANTSSHFIIKEFHSSLKLQAIKSINLGDNLTNVMVFLAKLLFCVRVIDYQIIS